jgi:hypothetical protein
MREISLAKIAAVQTKLLTLLTRTRSMAIISVKGKKPIIPQPRTRN